MKYGSVRGFLGSMFFVAISMTHFHCWSASIFQDLALKCQTVLKRAQVERPKGVVVGFFKLKVTENPAGGVARVEIGQNFLDFQKWISQQYKVDVLNYSQWEILEPALGPSPKFNAEKVFDRVVDLRRKQPSIFVDLTDFSPERAFRRGPPSRDEQSDFTNYEIHLILTHKDYFQSAKWFLNYRELNAREVISIFGQWYPHLWDKLEKNKD